MDGRTDGRTDRRTDGGQTYRPVRYEHQLGANKRLSLVSNILKEVNNLLFCSLFRLLTFMYFYEWLETALIIEIFIKG